MGQQFDDLSTDPQHTNEVEVQREEGSGMVLDDQPTPESSNTTLEAEIVDRESFDQNWEQERQDAQNRQDAAIEDAASRVAEAEAEAQSHDHQQDMGMG